MKENRGPAEEEEWVPEDDAVIGRAFRVSLIVIVAVTRAVEPPERRFTMPVRRSGISFVHHDGATGEKLLAETMGGEVVMRKKRKVSSILLS